MPQFDVHRNKGGNRGSIPYVVVVQSTLFDNYKLRVVVPLVKASSVGRIANPRFNPTFKIGNTTVVLHPHAIPLVNVAWGDIERFCEQQITEGTTLDYNRTFRNDLERTVAAMANTLGGLILISVEEDGNGKPALPISGMEASHCGHASDM